MTASYRLRSSLRFAPLVLACVLVVACGGSDGPPQVAVEPTPSSLSLSKIGGYLDTSLANPLGAAEITAYEPQSRRLFVINSVQNTVDVLDLTNPAAPVRVGQVVVGTRGAGVNSVAVSDGLVALAIEANPKTSPGVVAFVNPTTLSILGSVAVGALPDMLTLSLIHI